MNLLNKHHNKFQLLSLMIVTILVLAACSQATASSSISDYENWEEVMKDGKGKEVTILMWGGNESINQYMDTFVADHVKEMYDVTLKRVPMNAPDYLSKLLNEKKNGVEEGTADLLWINAENFRTAKEGGLIDGPFTDLLPNLATYYDGDSPDLSFDSGIPIEGHEGIWGRAQLVLTYDEAVTPNPPRTFEELKQWVMDNPGQFTYPKVPDDFVGVAFVRSAFYELNGQTGPFDGNLTEDAFADYGQPVMDYFNEIGPYLWREGAAYPATQAQLDDLFKNGEVAMTMGFEVGKTSGLVASGVYPDTVKSYVLDTGTIGNAHYLAVPYNSPEKAAALLVMDFLQSPKAQIEKMKPEVWGDMPAVDPIAMDPEEQATLASLDDVKGAVPLKELTDKRLPEMQATYIDWIKTLWVTKVGK
jgi:putative spermidine/putrescine transport system substrate-binding protein